MVPPQDASVDARLAVGASRHQPVVLRPRPFLNLPSKSFLIEFNGTFRIVCRKFKMNDAIHARFSFDYYFDPKGTIRNG
jgi:hypothetical protein